MRNASGCIAVYDITKRSSFVILDQLISDYLDFNNTKKQSAIRKYKYMHKRRESKGERKSENDYIRISNDDLGVDANKG